MKYNDLISIQMIIFMMKHYGVNYVVLSPGVRNVPFVHSVENDPFFHCFSIVDERSAAFFGLGLATKLQRPVCICCTSGTAVANYHPAIAEAFYQHVPLLVVTADRTEFTLNQREDQQIPQAFVFENICNKSVNLPYEIENQTQNWYCNRLLNEAFLSLTQNNAGPVHINLPIWGKELSYNCSNLPQTRIVQRHSLDNLDEWEEKAEELKSAKRIIVLYGQRGPVNESKKADIENFVKKYNCIISVDHLSNLNIEGCVDTFLASKYASRYVQYELNPDIIIVVNGNSISDLKNIAKIESFCSKIWHITPDGKIADQTRHLTDIFECSTDFFFKYFGSSLRISSFNSKEYLNKWKKLNESIKIPDLPYSDVYVVKKFIESLPSGTLLHLANSSSVRHASHFSLPQDVEVYCNRGTNGIDGDCSSFIGQSVVEKDKICYLLIGDLSFFYDMNGLWNNYIGNNVRILLNNNQGASLFYHSVGIENIPTLGKFVAASHNATAKGWVESRGFRYISAANEKELTDALKIFSDTSVKEPMFLEVFTNKTTEKEDLSEITKANTYITESKFFKASSFIKKVQNKLSK